MYLSYDTIEAYRRDGYILVPDLFTQREVRALLHEIEYGSRVRATTRGNADTSGRTAKLAIWHELDDDIWGAASTCPRIVNNVRLLLGEETAFFHGKVMLKEPRQGGAWEWHQDYGYWYNQGFAYPRLISAFVALDPATRENGCLEVLRGSHQLGRLDHDRVGAQTGADPARVAQVEPLFERIACEMTPGSVLFFHCNLLHTSRPNESDTPRRSFIICYNALGNPQLTERKTAGQAPCPISPDNAIEQIAALSY